MYRRQTARIEGSPMDILLFEPAGHGPFPGLVVAQHFPVAHMGLEKDPFTIGVGERLARAGYACAIPYLFHWWPPEEDTGVKRAQARDDWMVADMAAGFTALAGMATVDEGRIGVLGHCWGGRVSWLAACHNPHYKAAAMFYGGRVKTAMGPDNPPPITLAGGIACPMIGFFGNDDQNPSPEDVNDIEAALKAAGVAHEFHRYDGAGHGFQDFTNPERHRPAAADDAWQKWQTFFDARLKD